MKSIFIADDGKQFEDYDSCVNYEKKQKEELERKKKTKEARQKEVVEAQKKYKKLLENYLHDYPSAKRKEDTMERFLNFILF